MIRITEVRLYGTPRGRLVTLATIVLNDSFAVRDIRVLRSYQAPPAAAYCVLMPSRPRQDGTMAEFCHPIRREVRAAIESAILARLDEIMPAAKPASEANEQPAAASDR